MESNLNECLAMYRVGEMDLDELLIKCRPIIARSILRIFGKITEDWMQEGAIIALSSIQSYCSENHKHSFTTHLYNNINWEIRRIVWSDAIIRKPVWLMEKKISPNQCTIISSSTSIGRSISEMYQSEGFEFEQKIVDSDFLRERLSVLNAVQRRVMLLWANGYVGSEISRLLGVSPQRVYQIKTEAIELMQKKRVKNKKNIDKF
jgi:RNA polymerase sigma factor (sigma-70 family)